MAVKMMLQLPLEERNITISHDLRSGLHDLTIDNLILLRGGVLDKFVDTLGEYRTVTSNQGGIYHIPQFVPDEIEVTLIDFEVTMIEDKY